MNLMRRVLKTEIVENTGDVDVEGGDDGHGTRSVENMEKGADEEQPQQQQQQQQQQQHTHQSKQRATTAGGSGGGATLTCLVCGDAATGKHYGSVACNGCKGFFRRTIRRGYRYSCRFEGNCLIDRHNRAVCRACRYGRCIQFGMKREAVQNERDLIGKRTRSFSHAVVADASPRSRTSTMERGAAGDSPHLSPAQVSPSGGPGQQLPKPLSYPSSVAASSSAFSPIGRDEQVGGMGGLRSNSFIEEARRCQIPFNGRSELPTPQLSTAARTEYLLSSIGQKLSPQHPHETHSPSSSNATLMPTDPWDSTKGVLELLLKSEDKIKSLRETVMRETGKLDFLTKREEGQPHLDIGNGKKADMNDIFLSLHSQLLLVIEWAKNLRPFAELGTEDQTALLKNFASQHIVLCVAYRSINTSNFLKLLNDSCIPRTENGDDEMDDFYRKDCERVMDTLVAPMRFIQMDDVEFVSMKACVLFNPVAKGLSNESVMKVLDTRRKIFAALESYVSAKVPRDPNRIGDLTFFILSPLQSLAKSVSEDVLVTKLSGVARIDQLMEELILEETEPKELSQPSTLEGLSRSFSSTSASAPAAFDNGNSAFSPTGALQPSSQRAPSQVLPPHSVSPNSAPAGLSFLLQTSPHCEEERKAVPMPSGVVPSSMALLQQQQQQQQGLVVANSSSHASLLSSLAKLSPPSQLQQLQHHQHGQIFQQQQQQQGLVVANSSSHASLLSSLATLSPPSQLQQLQHHQHGQIFQQQQQHQEMLSTLSSYVLSNQLQGSMLSPSNDALLCAVSSSSSFPIAARQRPMAMQMQTSPSASTAAAAANAIHAFVVASVANSLAAASTRGGSVATAPMATAAIDWPTLLSLQHQKQRQQQSQQASPNGNGSAANQLIVNVASPLLGVAFQTAGAANGSSIASVPYSPYAPSSSGALGSASTSVPQTPSNS